MIEFIVLGSYYVTQVFLLGKLSHQENLDLNI